MQRILPLIVVLSLLLLQVHSQTFAQSPEHTFSPGEFQIYTAAVSGLPSVSATFPLRVYIDITGDPSDISISFGNGPYYSLYSSNQPTGCDTLLQQITFDYLATSSPDQLPCTSGPKVAFSALFLYWGNTDATYTLAIVSNSGGFTLHSWKILFGVRSVALSINTLSTTTSSISIELIGDSGSSVHDLGANFQVSGVYTTSFALDSDIGNLLSIKLTNSDPSSPWTFSTIDVTGDYTMSFGKNIKVKKSRILNGPISMSFSVTNGQTSAAFSSSPMYFKFQGPKYAVARRIAGPFSKGQTITQTFDYVNIRSIQTIHVRSYSIDDISFDSMTVSYLGNTKTFTNPSGQSLSKYHPMTFTWV